jgi:hypothetical protein
MPNRLVARRRILKGSLALAALSMCAGCGDVSLPWQQTPRVPRIGYLTVGTSTSGLDVFRDGLHALGYVEGRTFVIEARSAESTDQLPPLAAELVGLPVDVIVAASTTAVGAALSATRTIPPSVLQQATEIVQ